MALYSLGHSTLSEDDFTQAMDAAGVDKIIDVRSHPASKWPQFQIENLREWLSDRYEWEPRLGGWTAKHLAYKGTLANVGVDLEPYIHGKFPKGHIAGNRTGRGWSSVGLFDYSFFLATAAAMAAVDELLQRAKSENLALVCSEAVAWRCHRSMISDYVVWRGSDVTHIIPRYRKTLQPRCVVNLTKHSSWPDVKERLKAYDPIILECWKTRQDLAACVDRCRR